MKVTDEILNEWSFRCHDGIVDLNDPKKLRILIEILDEFGVNLKEEEVVSFEQHIATKILYHLYPQNNNKKLLKTFQIILTIL
jgi:hypothetical protein